MLFRSDTRAGRSRGPERVDLISAAEAELTFHRSDGRKRMLVLHAGYPPMILQRNIHYEDEPFKSLYDRWETVLS